MTRPWRAHAAPLKLGRRDAALRRAARALLRLPEAAIAPLAGRPRTNTRGDRLDPHTQLLIRLQARIGGGIGPEDPIEARAELRRGVGLILPPPAPVASIEDIVVAGDLPARLYRPAGERPPLLVYLHGGGFVVGDLATHDQLCRRLCAEGGLMVVSVDYRLAPEAPFPAGLQDAGRAWADLTARAEQLGADPARVGVGGDSAGGNLSAVLALRIARGQLDAPPPVAQILIYPATDFRRQAASHTELGGGLMLTSETIGGYLRAYGAPDPLSPDVSPLLAPDLSGLAPAVVTTAGFDPLRDEGEAYAARLAEAGVPVTALREPRLIHGYVQLDGFSPAADAAVRRLVAATQRALSTPR